MALGIYFKDMWEFGQQGRSLSKVNMTHLAPRSEAMPSLSQLVPAAAAERVQALVFTPCTDPVYFYLLKLWLLCLLYGII